MKFPPNKKEKEKKMWNDSPTPGALTENWAAIKQPNDLGCSAQTAGNVNTDTDAQTLI